MTSLLEQTGADEHKVKWQQFALCPETDPRWFFEKYEKDQEIAKQVDELCLSCPVMSQCAEFGSKNEYGVFGGIFWSGNGKPDENKNRHKTEAIWERIRTRISE